MTDQKPKQLIDRKSRSLKILASLTTLALLWGVAVIPGRAQGSENKTPTAITPGISAKASVSRVASKMSAPSLSSMRTMSAGERAPRSIMASGVGYFVLSVEFKTPVSRRTVFTDLNKSTIPNVSVLTTTDQFADVFIVEDDENAWNSLYRNPGVLRVEIAGYVSPPPPPTVKVLPSESRGKPESIVRGGYRGLTGKGVNIAILDTGIDFRHPDFATLDAKGRPVSRIKYFWDTSLEYRVGRGLPAPVKYPNGTSIGTIFTSDQLTAELRSGKTSIPPLDEDGHGTACASVAAGNGNADLMTGGLIRSAVKGVAPDADIVGVRLGPAGDEFANYFLIGAIMEWLDKAAGPQPLVVSGSFGGHGSAHDGQSVMERQLNSRFPLARAGRALLFAAGNEGSDQIHAKVSFSGDMKPVSWTADRATSINLYFSGNDNYTIYGTKVTPVGDANVRWELNPITNQWHGRIEVQAGFGAIWLKSENGRAAEADLYFLDSRLGAFDGDYVSYSNLVGDPGTTGNALTVGSYDWNDTFHMGGQNITLTNVCDGQQIQISWLSCYSSPGPRRGSPAFPAAVKPEIVSPGEWYPSANAKVNGETAGWGVGRTDSTGNYRQMNGTSAATPYTAGVVALFFQKRPKLTLGEVRNLLRSNATKGDLNPDLGAPPNNNWGFGKLDLPAIDKILSALEARPSASKPGRK